MAEFVGHNGLISVCLKTAEHRRTPQTTPNCQENRRPPQNTVDQQSSTYHKPNSRKNSAMQHGIWTEKSG